jgi:hypothetical protein
MNFDIGGHRGGTNRILLGQLQPIRTRASSSAASVRFLHPVFAFAASPLTSGEHRRPHCRNLTGPRGALHSHRDLGIQTREIGDHRFNVIISA